MSETCSRNARRFVEWSGSGNLPGLEQHLAEVVVSPSELLDVVHLLRDLDALLHRIRPAPGSADGDQNRRAEPIEPELFCKRQRLAPDLPGPIPLVGEHQLPRALG